MSRKQKILILFDSLQAVAQDFDYLEELKSPDRTAEHDVYWALKKLGYEVHCLAIFNETQRLVEAVRTLKPHLVFNLAETFGGKPFFESNLVSLLEMLEVPFTGTGSVGLTLAKNKGVTKKILMHHKIRTPHFWVIHRNDKVSPPRKLKYPLIVKPLREEASYGISQKSLVENDDAFLERVRFIHESMERDVIVEEFIVGRELYISVMGRQRLKVFPIREIVFSKMPDLESQFATFKAKWDDDYRKRWGIQNRFAQGIPEDVFRKIERTCKKVFKLLYLQGYGRIDARLTEKNELIVIEANPNPFIAKEEDFALSAKKGGVEYPDLVQAIVRLAGPAYLR